MKKLQKFLAILLAVSMCMSLLCIGASAAGPMFCLEKEHSHEAGDCQRHEHSADCFTTGCDMNETTPYFCDKTVHAHGDGNCNAEAEACNNKAEHTHGDGKCNGEICGLTAHIHDGVSCNDEDCELLEHTHGDGNCDSACTIEGHDCGADTAGACEMSDCSLDQHTHVADCCNQEEHTHDRECCTQEEHIHDATCCTLEVYAHKGDCYHTHTAWGVEETCYTVKTCEWEQDECMLKVHTHTEADCYAGDDDEAMIAGKGAYATLAKAVDAANENADADTIILLDNITMDANQTIKSNVTINGNGKTITRATTGSLFTVSAGATLTLDGGLTIDGGNNWTFDSEGYYRDMKDGLTVDAGSSEPRYTASAEGGIVSANSMIVVNGAVVMNNATIQNSWADNHNDGALFKIPAGATLTMNEGALIKHIHSSVVGQIKGTWTMVGGKIDDIYGHNTNGGVMDIRGGTVNINGGEITNVRTLGLNKNGNGILAQVYGSSSTLNINGGLIHGNANFSPGGGWGAVLYTNSYGNIVMNGGIIEDTVTDHCSAFAHKHPTADKLNGGTLVVEPSLVAWFDSFFYGDVAIGKDMEIVGEGDALICMLGDTNYKLDIDGEINGGTVWVMYNQPVTGEGTITSNVQIKADPSYFETDGKVTFSETTKWMDSVITVDSIGSDASLTVEPGVVIDGKQVRVLGSVATGDYLNKDESAAEQAAAFVKEAGATVESPVLYYHRLTSAQQQDVVVTFDYNGGLDASGWSGCQLTGAEAFAPALPAPTRGEDYKLIGWAYAKENDPESLSMESDAAYAGETITESVRLIAQWKEPDYVCYIQETGVKYETLTAAVVDANTLEGANTIVMVKNIDFDSTKALSVTGALTIIGEKTISRGAYTGTLFTVPAGSSLTLDGGIVFDGNNDWIFEKALYENDLYNRGNNPITAYAYSAEGGTIGTAAAFVVNGTVTDDGVVVNGTVTAKDATFQNFFSTKDSNAGDAAIFKVNANAVLDTNGALINHNATYGANTVAHLATNAKWYIQGDTMISNNFGGRNGGMCRNDSGQIYMSGGTIKDNAGKNVNGSVFMMYGAGSAFYMTGGTICGNSSVFGVSNGRCAAVYLHADSYMKMTGGTICHNVGGSRGGIDSYKSSSVLDINRVDQVFVNGVYANENGAAAYTASNHPVVVDNVSLLGYSSNDVGHSYNFDTWWVTGGIYTQDVDEFCAKGYICIPYEDTERTDDYIVVPGYRVKYYSVEKTESTNAETGEVTVDYTNTLVQKYFHMLPRDKFWYEMDEHAVKITVTDDAGRVINTWYTEQELVNLYNFNTQLESDLNLYGQWRTSGGGSGGGGPIVTPINPAPTEDPTEFVDIEEEDVPLTDLPEEAEEILDDEVPLAVPPKTGDASALWMALSALSGAGLFLVRKKREED